MAFESNPFRQRLLPTVVKNLLIINVIVYLFSLFLEKQGIDLTDAFGLHYFESSKFKPYQLVSYMFLHDPQHFTHIFFNMFALWMFGASVENEWGPKRFLTYYFVCGVGAAIVQNAAWYYSLKPILQEMNEQLNGSHYTVDSIIQSREKLLDALNAIGASGAVFGILLAYGMLFPNNLLFIIPIPFPIKAKYMVILYGLIELTQGVGAVRLPGDNVAHFAHLGGLLFGFLLIKYWQNQNRNRFDNNNPYNNY